MEYNVNFGQCLEILLCVRGWSAARLARELNVDPSYTRKWIRGTRVPSLQNDYVEQIADSLSSGLTSYNKDSIKSAFIDTIKDMHLEVNEGLPLKELLFECLSNAQIYSLSLDCNERQNKLNTEQKELENLVAITTDKFTRLNDCTYSHDYKLVSEFPDIPLIIHGRTNILNAAIGITKAAIERNHNEKTNILLTFQGENEVFYEPDKLDNIFDYEIKNALKEGVDVYHFFRLNKNINRSLKIIEKIINFIGYKGHYLPYYFNKYGTLKFPMEFIICEGVGAIMCFSNSTNEFFDTAIFYSQEEAVSSLKKYFDLHFIETSPLVENYGLDDYYKYITEIENRMGDLFSFQDEFGTITYPYSLWVKFLNRSVDDENVKNEHLARIHSIIQSFHEQVEHYNFCTVADKRTVEHMVRTGRYPTYNKYREYQLEDIIEHLENIVFLLKKHKNYNLALVSDNKNTLINKITWSVKGNYSVFLLASDRINYDNSATNTGLILIIKETTIVSAFRDHYLDLWDKISPVDKEKEVIIEWFETQIAILKKQLLDN